MQTFGAKFIAKKEQAKLSPTTIKGYDKILRNTPQWFLDINLYDINESMMQKLIKEYGEDHAPKSTKNLHGFWHSVLDEYRSNFTYTVKLPASAKKIEYEPTSKDIGAIVEYAKGTRYENIIRLCVLGLRRGEAMCIYSTDIDEDNVLTISKDLVVDKDNKIFIKDHPKTSASYRRIPIDDDLVSSIKLNGGKAYTGSTSALNKFLRKAQDELGIPRFKLHMTRHFCAAYLHKSGYSDEEIMAWLGWDDPSTMSKIYRYNLDPAENMADMKKAFDKFM
jgi:integrase